MTDCRICNSKIEKFMSFGDMPIANGFLMPDQFNDEYSYELAPAFCSNCGAFQLIEQPRPEQMFHDNYAFFAGTSQVMMDHFQELADIARDRYLDGDDPFVVEIGSNDGGMIETMDSHGIRHLGIEPSGNVADAARAKGLNVWTEFFNEDLADKIIAEYGHADVFLGANVLAHIGEIQPVVAGIAKLLKPKGVMITEDPYLGEMVRKTGYDQIYDEHVFIFSLRSMQSLAALHGMEVIDVEPLPTAGGSMRYYICRKGERPVSDSVRNLAAQETEKGLEKPETYDQFRRNFEKSRSDLLEILNTAKAEGKRVVGYGATSKSTTVNIYCGITSDLVEFISDTTPTKQGKFSPGAHVPVKPHEDFVANYPDFALLYAWNHREEIMAKEDAYGAAGGKWIVYVPKLEVF